MSAFPSTSAPAPIRVLVVDDSAVGRRTVGETLRAATGYEVVGRAGDGRQALALAFELEPDVVTLDLEMPEMDGFTFLRLLLARRPTPVIVVSGRAAPENVFRALELGALDFVAKPSDTSSQERDRFRRELTAKLSVVRSARLIVEHVTATRLRAVAPAGPPTPAASPEDARLIVAIGASTGGPKSLLELLGRLRTPSRAAFVVAVHMAERFTRTFAERLSRLGTVRACEAEDGMVLRAGHAYVCPGGSSLELVARSGNTAIRVVPPRDSDRWVPSVDRLFRSGAEACGPRFVAVVLTGMGDDGALALAHVKQLGGAVFAESPLTATVDSMPAAAVASGFVDRVAPIVGLADAIGELRAP
ncbi:MAG: chemotaxis-specific protein-glutamate methyltransferase CheB [Deltaproteobacteria bacterium]|nr:chemotaxis-specific protein-glutamate methyltransferase CheB [Deltaproteobacteria bacterium]